MSQPRPRPLGRALRLALAASAVGQFLGLPLVLAQAPNPQPEAEPSELAPMLVTGSYVPTLDEITASPIQVIEADVLRKVAATDVADLLRKTSPDFQGSLNLGQERNDGGYGEANLALRNLPTLVLLNGRRLASSSFSAGTAVDLNTIPVSMIERIEVLKDGASAIYGADAIGGVVNIILRKGYNGAEVGAQYGVTTRSDGYQQYSAYATGGISNERTSFTLGAQYYFNDPLLASDRFVASADIHQLDALGLKAPIYFSSIHPGRVEILRPDYSYNQYVLAGSKYAQGLPGYQPGMTSIPDAYLGQGRGFNLDELVAAGVYLPVETTAAGKVLGANNQTGYPLFNTAEHGAYSIQRQDRRQIAATGEHQLLEDALTVYGDFLYSENRSRAAMAPAMAWGLGGIPATHRFNPFGADVDGSFSGPLVLTRFMELGPRVFESESSYYRALAGFKGRMKEDAEWIEDLRWSTGFNYNRSDQIQRRHNMVSLPALSQALEPDLVADPTGQSSRLRDSLGNPVPLLDPFGLEGNPRNQSRTFEAIRASLFQDGSSELMDLDAVVTARALDLPAGKVGWAVGGLFRWEDLRTTYDDLTRNGLALGYPMYPDFPGGRRNGSSGFIEASLPILSPEMGISWARSLEISAAGRFESLDPGGNTAIPKVGLRWEPVDRNVVLRSTYSKGVIAPALYDLYGVPAESYPSIILPDGPSQQRVTFLSDPNVQPSTATTWTGGFVLTPEAIPGLLVSVDYYTINNAGLSAYDIQAMVDSLNALGPASPHAGDFEFNDGSAVTGTGQINSLNWGNAFLRPSPGAAQRTDGLDLAVAYEWRTDHAGTFLLTSAANVLLNYEYRKVPGAPFHEYAGQYSAPDGAAGQGTLPRWNLSSSLAWDYRDLTVAVYSRYIPSLDDPGSLHPAAGGTEHGMTTSGGAWEVDPWFSVDLQVAYEIHRGKPVTRWYDGFRFAAGVNNVSDQDVPIVASAYEDNTDKITYNILGRFVYLQVSKKF